MRHPLHPMLAHFPVACWSIATIADIARPSAWYFAGTLMWIGALIAVPTIFIGIFDLIQIPKEPGPIRAGFMHMGVMLMAFLIYLGSLLLRVHEGHLIQADFAARTFSVIGFAFLLFGAWLGGTLVYGYGAGGDRKDGDASAEA